MGTIQNITVNLKTGFDNWSEDRIRKLFSGIDQLGIKHGVDKMGLDKFILNCARMSALTGAISGGGGAVTMAVGIPLDLLNLVTQQIRVTLGIIYYYRGDYQVSFDEFLSIMAAALQVEAGIAVTKNLLERGTERAILRVGPKTAGRLIPVAGALIGGMTNYMFVKRMANKIKAMQYRYEPITIPVEETSA